MCFKRGEYYNERTRYQLQDGPQLTGFIVQHNDLRHVVVIDHFIIPMTKTEYNLCMIIMEKMSQFQTEKQMDLNVFTAFECLEKQTKLPRWLIMRHINNANGKLLTTGITINRVGDHGYTLVFKRSTHDGKNDRQHS
jgi:hypothetical protein